MNLSSPGATSDASSPPVLPCTQLTDLPLSPADILRTLSFMPLLKVTSCCHLICTSLPFHWHPLPLDSAKHFASLPQLFSPSNSMKCVFPVITVYHLTVHWRGATKGWVSQCLEQRNRHFTVNKYLTNEGLHSPPFSVKELAEISSTLCCWGSCSSGFYTL